MKLRKLLYYLTKIGIHIKTIGKKDLYKAVLSVG